MLGGGDESAAETTVTLLHYKVSSSDSVSVFVLGRSFRSSPSYGKKIKQRGEK